MEQKSLYSKFFSPQPQKQNFDHLVGIYGTLPLAYSERILEIKHPEILIKFLDIFVNFAKEIPLNNSNLFTALNKKNIETIDGFIKIQNETFVGSGKIGNIVIGNFAPFKIKKPQNQIKLKHL